MPKTFTPGPWSVGSIDTTVVSEAKVETTRAYKNDGGVNDSKYYGGSLIAESVLRKENAKLIAAAPDMYDVLINLLAVEDEHELSIVIDSAKSIVNKVDSI